MMKARQPPIGHKSSTDDNLITNKSRIHVNAKYTFQLQNHLQKSFKILQDINVFLVNSTVDIILRDKPIFDEEKLKLIRLNSIVNQMYNNHYQMDLLSPELLNESTNYPEWNLIAREINTLMKILDKNERSEEKKDRSFLPVSSSWCGYFLLLLILFTGLALYLFSAPKIMSEAEPHLNLKYLRTNDGTVAPTAQPITRPTHSPSHLPTSPPTNRQFQTAKEFSFTGSYQQFTVPNGIYQLQVDVYGGQGGNGWSRDGHVGGIGGKGGHIRAWIDVQPNQLLYLFVGSSGTFKNTYTGRTTYQGMYNILDGTFNGGGATSCHVGGCGGGGGGSSDIRITLDISGRIVVGGGGGGGGEEKGKGDGGWGGGDIASTSGPQLHGGDCVNPSTPPTGGTQVSGGRAATSERGGATMQATAGTLFQGGTGGRHGGGGGGGYYGGGGGYCHLGGAGGSSFLLKNGGNTILLNEQGIQEGHGKIVIRY